jgi:hypothetical protein
MSDINPILAGAGQADTQAAEKNLHGGNVYMDVLGNNMLDLSAKVTQVSRAMDELLGSMNGRRTGSTNKYMPNPDAPPMPNVN